ncbi:MAG TPA: ABC transporter ATP-binding protein [Terriglobales bacterium]|nr:ABC transporter ATP-binding protein [Terriglobales bacterium]
MIELTALRKQFGGLIAVNSIDLTIPKGEIYGLIGPNGAGKTTTIRMMCGLLAPTTGQVKIAGVDVCAEPERAQGHIGYLSDFFAVYDDLKVWEYLDYFAHAYKMPEPEIPGRVREVISEVALEVKTDSMIAGLSRGMKQRLGIARAIIHKPEVLLLDEPASGLDPKARFELRVLLQRMRDQGTTILISSHILTELEGFCTSIGIMERGRLVRSGRIEDVTASESPVRTIDIGWVGTSQAPTHVLAEIAGVSDVQLASGEGHFQFMGSDESLSQLLAALISAKVQVTSFGERRTTVEDLYMKISHHEVM